MSEGGSWLQYGNSMNKFKSSYMKGFLDISGNLVVREGNMTMLHGDISCNGELYVNRIRDRNGNIVVSSGGGGTVIDDTSNLTIDSVTALNVINATNKFIGNVGIGKATTANALDVSGNVSVSGNLTNNGAFESLGANASIGKVVDTDYSLDINGSMKASANAYVNNALVVATNASISTDISNAAIFVKATRTDTSHNVVFDAPNTVMRAQNARGNITRTNHLEFDTKNRRILPYVRDAAGNNVDISGSVSDGWELGGPGPNRFDKIYARDVKISTNTLLVEDDDGNLIGMSFNAATGAVNYNVTTKEGEQFTIKGVQTQKISSGGGTIDPSLLEFTGLAFGDTFDSCGNFDLSTTYTYDLSTKTYNVFSSTEFEWVVGPQNLEQFLSIEAKDTLLGSLTTGDSVVIRVGTDTGRDADNFLAPFETSLSQTDLTDKIIIAKKKTSSLLEWTLWSDEETLMNNTPGNFLNYIELKNINMASGTYFVAKTAGDLVYNITNVDFITTDELSGVVNGDLFLYIARGLGNNWTKIPVSLPQSGSISTQHMADAAITSSKIGLASIEDTHIKVGTIMGNKIADGQIGADHIASGAISASSFLDGSIAGGKITDGTILLSKLGANVLDGKQDTLVGGENITITGNTISAVVTTNIANGDITASKLAINSVTADKIAADAVTGSKIQASSIEYGHLVDDAVITRTIKNSNVTSEKIATGGVLTYNLGDSSVTTLKLADGNVTTSKILDANITTSKIANANITGEKLHADVVNGFLAAGANVTLSKAANGIVTIASSGGGGGGVALTSTTDIVVRDINMHGDLSGNDASFNTIEMNRFAGHILPTTNEAFDIGSADKKIRHLFLSDNSLWLGDEHKLGIDEGSIKFQKRNKNIVPSGIAGGNIDEAKSALASMGIIRTNASDFKLEDWQRYAKFKGVPSDVNDMYLSADIDEVNIASSGGGVALTSTTDVDVRDINVYGDLSGNDASFNVLEANNIEINGTLSADTISEKTSGAGVTIDNDITLSGSIKQWNP